MQLAIVVGSATATLKHASMKGQKLLLVQPTLADGQSPDGDPLLVVDGVGAGRGEIVMITSDGRGARELLKTEITPVRWTIVGIKDPDSNQKGTG
jgi:ethanolamine utilization protein EutN